MSEIRDRAEDSAPPSKRCYGLLVIVEADSPGRAREYVATQLLLKPAGAAAEGVWVGAPQEGIPLVAEEFGDETLTVAFDLPDDEVGRSTISIKLESPG